MTIQHTISVWNAYRKLSADNDINDTAGQATRNRMLRQVSELAAEIQSPGDTRKKIITGWSA